MNIKIGMLGEKEARVGDVIRSSSGCIYMLGQRGDKGEYFLVNLANGSIGKGFSSIIDALNIMQDKEIIKGSDLTIVRNKEV